LERRSADHFEFMWSLVLDESFSRRLKHIPDNLTPKDLLHLLNRDYIGLVPKRRAIQWVVFKGDQPIGVSMFVGINFENRSTEQILGILPEFDQSFSVGDAYCASLLFAYNTLGLHRVVGNIYDDNQAVATIQERFGFRREGHLIDAVWDQQHQRYIDVIQIAMLRAEFERSRVLQRFIARESRSPWLMTPQEWPRKPLDGFQG
jgi:RimJ/RimL family protein N-acetyltransferase